VLAAMPGPGIARVKDEDRDFYGRRYWFEYQERELGTPDITVRARSDLPERCVYWLRTVLRYRLPPARALDVGCGHGGFVMLLSRAGFEASGLELSPWVVDFARKTFAVSVLRGPLDEQDLGPGSLDVITLMDVLEHLPDPLATLQSALAALADDGFLVIQTPAVPPGLSWEDMVAADHPFLPLMRERGHLYLFSAQGLQRLLGTVGLAHTVFEPAYFPAYDMFAVSGRRPLAPRPEAKIAAPAATPDGRLVQALLDLDDRLSGLRTRYAEAERDRAARLAALHEQGDRLMFVEGERNVLREEVRRLEASRAVYVSVISDRGARLAAAEADRAARLAVIQEQGARLATLERDFRAREAELAQLRAQLVEADADRAASRKMIEEQEARLNALQRVRCDLQRDLAQGRVRLRDLEGERADGLRVIAEQAERLDGLTRERDDLRAELLTRQGADVGDLARRLVRRMRAGLQAAMGRSDPRRTAAGAEPARPPVPPPGAPPPSTSVEVYDQLSNYVSAVDDFIKTRPDLVSVREYNHAMVQVLDGVTPLVGRTMLDVGASPHGFSLEEALARGVLSYVGVGLGVPGTVEVHHEGSVGRLIRGDAEVIGLAADSVDVAMSLSTFEHFSDGAAVLREVHRVLRPGGRLFVNFQPVWTSSEGHHLHHLANVTRVIPPWAHLLWTPETMRRALAERWPADAEVSLEEAVAWIYESREINRLDIVTLRGMFEAAPFVVEWMTPLPDGEDLDRRRLASYLSGVMPYSSENLLTRGFSIMMRKG
jgi:SAM-dependent methyltransferase